MGIDKTKGGDRMRLTGYRTYITVMVIALYNILRAMGVEFGDVSAELSIPLWCD